MVGEGITRLIEKILGDKKLHMRDEIIKMFIEYYSEHLSDYSREYPYVRETLEQLSEVRKLGVRWAQGYLFSEPLDADPATDLVLERVRA